MIHPIKRGTSHARLAAISLAMIAAVLVAIPGIPDADAATSVVFDDMEHGDPLGNGWFVFGGDVGGGGISPNAADLPPTLGGAFSLETGWGSGGTPGFYGGFGRTNPTDLTGTDHFNFWINPDSGQDYTLEINLQEDDNGDDAANPADDDEFQFDCAISAAGPCATSGAGWQFVSIPLADFFDDNSFFTGGNGVLDPVPAPAGNGQLINVVIAVTGTGSDVNFRTDYWAFSEGPLAPAAPTIIDDFENGLPSGTDGDGVPIGFFTFSDGSPVSVATTNTPPAPVPGSAAGNNVLALTGDVTAFAGVIHAFENAAVDTWVPQDWSGSEGMSFWLYGLNTGTTLFIDVIDNRNPGSTADDGERFTISLIDDFAGWQLFEFPFSSFTRKEIGNGAPNDGFTLTEVHGWALGTLDTPGEVTYYMDDVALYGVAEIPELAISFALGKYLIEEGTTGDVTVKLNRALGDDDPAAVSVDYATEPATADPDRDYTPTSGTLTFTKGGPQELSFPLETFDNSKFTGDKRVTLRLSNPTDAGLGAIFQASVLITDNDPYDADLIDDFEQGAYLWDSSGLVTLSAPEIESGDPLAVPGQGAYEGVLEVTSPAQAPSPNTIKQSVVDDLTGLLPLVGKWDRHRIERAIAKVDKSLDDKYWANGYFLNPKGSQVFTWEQQAAWWLERVRDDAVATDLGEAVDSLVAADRDLAATAIALAEYNDGKAYWIKKATSDLERADRYAAADRPTKAIASYRRAWSSATKAVRGLNLTQALFGRDFPLGQDWSRGEALGFWYYGTGSGDEVTVQLKDNRAPDPGPDGWTMVWSDEFNEPAGTPPNPDNWEYELGDVTPDGKNGWGNEELQYYTDDPANAATDGNGNLVLTLREADGSLECYYGPCEYTSARLNSWHKAEFAYGRIESRVLVPQGAGLWPAVWSLGTDIDRNPWPQAGEIDIMEFVGRLPDEIFGTIHGPGYSGGQSFGNVYNFGEPVFNDYHTFVVEWQPDSINWYVDDILYHSATPADVAPNEWVFEKPFFLLLNVAVGGNFGGAVGDDTTFPQATAIDYVRVYQGPDTAERFEASFVDSAAGWQQVQIPFGDFARSADQPAGAPNDGLGLSDVWGYGFELPYASEGTSRFDQVRLIPIPAPTEITVTNLNDSGDGSLRKALNDIAEGGTISFDPALAGGTIALTSGQLVVNRDVTVDGAGAPGLTVSGNGASRVVQVDAGVEATINDITVSDGVGAPQGGGILNLGVLSLDRVAVTNNTESSGGAASFDLGGGGIYNGDGATLNLTDSTVSDNATLGQPGGGIYGFFNSTINVTSSTVSGNVAGDVAGGLRTLGDVTIVNSTISGNTSTAWHGGAMFVTDGTVTIVNSTIADNTAPSGTAGGLMVATFGAPVELTLQNSIVADNGDYGCQVEGSPAAAVLTSLGNNVFTDGSCNPIGSDQVVADAGLGVLADNGGTTLTHALLAGSAAIDAANAAACPATDQRGVVRPQGAGCDVGAFELAP